jgi:hypothetical protein
MLLHPLFFLGNKEDEVEASAPSSLTEDVRLVRLPPPHSFFFYLFGVMHGHHDQAQHAVLNARAVPTLHRSPRVPYFDGEREQLVRGRRQTFR